jgi:hypothetical protein
MGGEGSGRVELPNIFPKSAPMGSHSCFYTFFQFVLMILAYSPEAYVHECLMQATYQPLCFHDAYCNVMC